jgi:hypothetical protein
MNRWKASGLHLLISLIVIGSITALIYFLWFPHRLIVIAGMDRLLITMLMVDIVAGPMLTLIVFKKHDMRLTRRDLTVIGFLQAAFLFYALHTAWTSRPVFLIWSVDKMYLMYANDIEPEDLAKGRTDDARGLSWFGPRLFAIDLPKDHDARAQVFIDLIAEQTSLERLPKHYGEYGSQREKILRMSFPVDPASLPDWMPAANLSAALTSVGRDPKRLRMVQIESARAASMLLIDAKTAAPLLTVSPPPPKRD